MNQDGYKSSEKHTSNSQANKQKTEQPIIQTWIQKLRLAHYAKQTHPTWTIRTHGRKLIQETETIWTQQCETVKIILKQKETKTHQKTNPGAGKLKTYRFINKSRKRQRKQILKLMRKTKKTPKLHDLKENIEKHAHTWYSKHMEKTSGGHQSLQEKDQAQEKPRYNCATCESTFDTKQKLSNPRANKPTCKKEWEKEHGKLRTCPQENSEQQFQTVKDVKRT